MTTITTVPYTTIVEELGVCDNYSIVPQVEDIVEELAAYHTTTTEELAACDNHNWN